MAKNSKYLQLLNVFKLMSESLNFDYIKATIIEQAKAVFKAEASSLIFLDSEKNELFFEVATGEKGEALKEIRFPSDQGIAGWIIKNEKPLLVEDVSSDRRFYKGVDKKSDFITRSIIGTPVYIDGKVIGLIEVLNPIDKKPFQEADLELLRIFADMAALNLKNAMWHKDALEKERIESDLRLAGEIQEKLLPDADTDIEGYDLYTKYKSCKSVGGDYFDILRFSDGRYLIIIADVSGKGAPASIVMSTVRAYLRSAVYFNLNLSEIIHMVNRYICGDTEAGRFVTMIIGELDTESHILRYVNAGHNYPYLKKSAGEASQLESNDIPVGILADYDYAISNMEIGQDDTLLFYTDGISECADKTGSMYGDKLMEKDLSECGGKSLREIGDKIFETAYAYAGHVQHDDMTLLLLRRR